MPLAAPPEQIAAAFAALQLPDGVADPQQRREALQRFCQKWLLPAESDLLPAALPELAAGPPPAWLPLVPQPAIRQWAEHLYRMWGSLCRQVRLHTVTLGYFCLCCCAVVPAAVLA